MSKVNIEKPTGSGSLVRLAQQLSPFVTGYEGNVSCRLDDETFLIKGSGRRMSCLQDKDLVLCRFAGEHLGGLMPSMEIEMHRALLSLPNVRYVAHTHPTNVLKVMCSADEVLEFADRRIFPDQVVFNGPRSLVLDYRHPGDDLGLAIRELMASMPIASLPAIVLLKNHGVVAVGETADQCLVATEICEKSAEIFIGCKGRRSYLTDQEVDRLVNDEMEKHRKKATRDDILR